MTFARVDIALAVLTAAGVQGGFAALLAAGEPHDVRAEISDDNAKPIAVEVQPVLDEDLPLLKFGGKAPGRLPDMWQRPTPIARKKAPDPAEGEGATPSTKAEATPSAMTSAAVGDGGPLDASPDAALVTADDAALAKKVDESAADIESGPPPVTGKEGSADGVLQGTETDPLKAQQISIYRAQLDGWFSARFPIRGKIPFEQLKSLRASVAVTVDGARRVSGFTIVKPSGDPTFDAELARALGAIRASGAELPAPPPKYPDVLGTTLQLAFRCSIKSQCE